MQKYFLPSKLIQPSHEGVHRKWSSTLGGNHRCEWVLTVFADARQDGHEPFSFGSTFCINYFSFFGEKPVICIDCAPLTLLAFCEACLALVPWHISRTMARNWRGVVHAELFLLVLAVLVPMLRVLAVLLLGLHPMRWDVLQLLADLVVLAQALLVVHLRHPQRFHLVHLLLVQLLGLALLKFLQLVHLLVWAWRRSDRSIPCPYASEIAFGLSIDFRALRTRHLCSTWAWSVVLEESSNFKGKSFIRLGMNRQTLDLLCVLTK